MRLTILTALLFICKLLSAQTVTWDGGGDGVSWEDQDNWDTNSLPCGTCDVVIHDDSVVTSSIITLKSLTLSGTSGGGALYVEESAELYINDAIDEAIRIFNGSRIHSRGYISIDKPGTSGISVSSGIFYSLGKSILSIKTAGEQGITLGSLGKIYLGPNVSETPEIRIYDSFENGIENFGEVHLDNGILTINKSGFNGIRNANIFSNAVTVNIDSSGLASILNNTVNGNFENSTTGNLLLTRGSNGFRNESFFENKGNMYLKKSTFNAISGTFQNSGLIDLEGTGSSTVEMMTVQSKLINTGMIYFDGVFGYGIRVDNNSDSLINAGQITVIDPVYFGIFFTGNPSVVYNEVAGNITIKDGSYYIRGNGQFHNKGNILLQNTHPTFNSGQGIYIYDNSGKFTNEGNIEFWKLSIGINNGGPGSEFEISTSGSCHFLNTNDGISNRSYFSNLGSILMERNTSNINTTLFSAASNNSEFYNDGQLMAKYTYSTAINNGYNGALFFNDSNGVIEIDTVQENNTNPGKGLVNQGKVVNRGLIDIKDSTAWAFHQIFAADSVINSGRINGPGLGFFSNSPYAIVQNLAGGDVDINGIFTHSGHLINEGKIEISKGNFFAAQLTNSDSVYIHKGYLEAENIQNLSSGLIEIDSCTADKAIETTTKLENHGTVRVNAGLNLGIKFSQGDTLINSGKIVLKNLETGIETEDLEGVIINLSSGLIDIDSCSVYAIHTQSNILNEGQIELNACQNGLIAYGSLPNTKIHNYGNLILENLTIPYNTFERFINESSAELIAENCFYQLNSFSFTNNGSVQLRDCEEGIWAQRIYNSGNIFASNIAERALRHPGTSGQIFRNELSGEIYIENSSRALSVTDSSLNYGNISLFNCERGMDGFSTNFGTINIKKCDVAIGGSFINKSHATLFIDSTGAANILLNEPCGYIKTFGGIYTESNFDNYGFFSHEDSLNVNIRFNNYGYFENIRGIRMGQFFDNFGVMTGSINGKPSEGIKEMNAAYKAISSTGSLGNFYTNTALTQLAGSFNAADNSIMLNANGVQADTLYTSVNYGPGCTTTLRIPVKQSPNCGGVYPTITSSFLSAIHNYDWHHPESWVEEIVPDDCSNVILNRSMRVPTNTKARAKSIEALGNGYIFTVEPGAILDVNPNN